MHAAILRDLNEPAPQDVLQIGRGGGGWNSYYHVCSSFGTHTRTLTHTLMHTHSLSPPPSLSLSGQRTSYPATYCNISDEKGSIGLSSRVRYPHKNQDGVWLLKYLQRGSNDFGSKCFLSNFK